MAKLTKFPQQISVKIEADGEDGYLVASPGHDMLGHAEMGQRIKVAIYTLTEVREVSGVATFKTIKQ